MKEKRIAVIGGGLGGLSCAVSLASAGFAVTLFEKNDYLGGKAGSRRIGGYRFDTGPSLLTMPHVFTRLFERAGRNISDYLHLIGLSPLTRYWFSDGTRLKSDLIEPFIEELTGVLDVTREEAEKYAAYSRKIYELTHRVFLESSLHRFATYRMKETRRALLHLGSIDLFRTMHAANSASFRDRRMVQLLDRYATYNGSDPYRAPATLNNIFHVEHGLGGFAVEGGIHAVPKALGKLASELGADIRTSARVERILLDGAGGVRGIETDQEELPFDLVVSDVDVMTLYEQLLKSPDDPMARRYRKLPSSSSALVFFWGMSRSFPELGLHNIFFSNDYRREFSQIHTRKQLPDDPTVYVNITSKITREDAPRGGENWFVLVNAPPDDGRSWEDETARIRKAVLQRTGRALGVRAEDFIAEEEVLTPGGIAEETGSFRGSLYGISSNTRMAAFNRHRNDSVRIPGLYLCGGSVHPGGGMPLVLLSGMTAADLIESDLSRRRGRRWES